MTKTKTAPSSKSVTNSSKENAANASKHNNPTKGSYRHRMLALVMAANKTAILIWLIGFAAFTIDWKLGTGTGVTLGMLYVFANNGKLSGRADGNVYNVNGVVRGWANPSLVQNEATSTQRTSFSELSSGWNSLSQSDMASWNAMTWLKKSNRVGQIITIKGKEAYIALNRTLFNIGASLINRAPVPVVVSNPSALALAGDESAHTLALTFTPTPVPAATSWEVYATAQMNPGVFRPGASEYRLIQILPAATTSPQALGTLYEARFGDLTAGQKIFVKVVAVSTTSGQKSTGLVTSTIVSA